MFMRFLSWIQLDTSTTNLVHLTTILTYSIYTLLQKIEEHT